MVEFPKRKTNIASSLDLKMISSVCTTPLYRKERWLKQKYEVEKLPARQIAVLIGRSHNAVNSALKRFGMVRERAARGRFGFEVRWGPSGRIVPRNLKLIVGRMKRLREQGLSYREIAQSLESKGIKAPSGKVKWYGCTVRSIYCGIGKPRPSQNKTLEFKYTIEYSYIVKKPTKVSAPLKRIHAVFYASDSGNEPVKEALLELGRPTKTIVGEDVRFVELNWRVDRPYVDRLRSGRGEFEETLYEVRHTVVDIEYRTLFFVSGSQMVLVHFFKKTSQKTPKSDLDLGWERMKKWVRADKENQRKAKKEKRSHAQKK